MLSMLDESLNLDMPRWTVTHFDPRFPHIFGNILFPDLQLAQQGTSSRIKILPPLWTHIISTVCIPSFRRLSLRYWYQRPLYSPSLLASGCGGVFLLSRSAMDTTAFAPRMVANTCWRKSKEARMRWASRTTRRETTVGKQL